MNEKTQKRPEKGNIIQINEGEVEGKRHRKHLLS